MMESGTEVAELRTLLKRYKSALEEIYKNQGKVCEDFETCTHVSCSSSSASWLIADKALHEEAKESKLQPTD